MGAAMTGMALHGGVLPVGGTFFTFSDYMRAGGAAGRACRGPTSSTRGPTTRSASARTARPTSPSSTWLAAGHARPAPWSGRPTPTRCAQAWRLRGGRRRADRADPAAARTCRCWPRRPDWPPRGCPGAATCCAREGGAARGRADRHRQRGPAVPRRGRPARRARAGGAGRLASRAGNGSRTRTTATAARCCPPGVPALAVEAAASFGWERYADATRVDRHLRRLGPRAQAVMEHSASPRARRPSARSRLLEQRA